MPDQNIIALLRKYINNECIPEELKRVEEILKTGNYEEEWSQVIEEDQIISSQRIETISIHKKDFIYYKLKQSIEEGAKRKNRIPFYRSYRKIAASILVILLAGVFVYITQIGTKNSSIAITAGDKRKVLLPDGSEVWVNKNSSIKYPDEFGDLREVILEGEAFFSVVKDPAKPFVVHAGGLKTVVLGTSFNINASSDRVSVTVLTGKVKVVSAGNSNRTLALITPNQQLKYSKKSKQASVISVDSHKLVMWKEDALQFNNETLELVALRLEEHYHVKFHLEENIKNCRIKVSFKNETLTKVLEEIKLIAEVDFEIRENHVYISGNGCY